MAKSLIFPTFYPSGCKPSSFQEGNAYEKKKGDAEWQKIAYKKDTAVAQPTATVKAAA